MPGEAQVEFQDGEFRVLKPGALADLAVLSEDFFTLPVADLARIRSELTMVGGRVVYEAKR